MIGIFIVYASGCGLAIFLFLWGWFYDRNVQSHTKPLVDNMMNSISSRLPSRLRPSNNNREQPVFTDSRDFGEGEDRIPPPSQIQIEGTYLTSTLNDTDTGHRWTNRQQRASSMNGSEGSSYF